LSPTLPFSFCRSSLSSKARSDYTPTSGSYALKRSCDCVHKRG
jgi:hypothetical protein